MKLSRYFATVNMCAKEKLSNGVLALYADYGLRLVFLIPLLLLWRSLYAHAPQVGMSYEQVMSYTLLATLLADVLKPVSPMCTWMYEGVIIDLYRRPMSIFGQLIAQTIGGWLPTLVFYSLPVLVGAGLMGVNFRPASAWFFASLPLAVALGFAVDFMFAMLMIRFLQVSYFIYGIRQALTMILSGAVLPFALMPFGLGRALALQPLGSVAGAPLALFVGTAGAAEVIALQVMWNVILWPVVIGLFAKLRERMVSYGG